MLCVLILYRRILYCRSQFKVDSERQIFWDTFHGNFYLTLRVFARNLLRGNHRRNNFRISFWYLAWEWNYFPLLTGRIVLLNKKRNLRKYSVIFLKHFPIKNYLADLTPYLTVDMNTSHTFKKLLRKWVQYYYNGMVIFKRTVFTTEYCHNASRFFFFCSILSVPVIVFKKTVSFNENESCRRNVYIHTTNIHFAYRYILQHNLWSNKSHDV